MTPERWQKVEEILEAARDRALEERSAYVEGACSGDQVLRNEVESLLAHDLGAGSFMESPAFQLDSDFSASDLPEAGVGQFLGSYKVISEIGRGGMGVVYLAQDIRLRRRVALKLLPEYFTTDKDRVRRFHHEAFAVSALNHPNILTIYDIGQTQHLHYIVTEFVDGLTLREKIATDKMSLGDVIDVGAQLASALKAAHAKGIVHRDIKPENIMIRRDDGYVKVLDFGLAKLTEPLAINSKASTAFHTRPGVFIGTPTYMSPEQVSGLPVDARSDLFSLGAVLYECFTSKPVFSGENVLAIWEQIRKVEPPPPSTFNPRILPELDRITMKALAKPAAERYQSADELLADLEALRYSGAVSNRVRAQPLSYTPETSRSSALKRISETLRRPRLSITSSILTLFLISFAFISIVWWIRNQPAPSHEMQVAPLTNTGKSIAAAISPDGKYLAHVEEEAGNQTLLVSRNTTASSVIVVPGEKVNYIGVNFSADGDYLYFVRYETRGVGKLYQVPSFGGPVKKILEGVDSPVTLSPDSNKFAFVRFNKIEDTYHLVVVNADSLAERVLAVRKGNSKLSTNGLAWSPDGKRIIFSAGGWEGGYHMDLIEIAADGGTETPIHSRKWFIVAQIAWPHEGNNLIISAAEQPVSPFQIWRVTYPEGKVERITSDTNDYDGISLTADASKIVSAQQSRTSKIWVSPASDTSHARPVLDIVGASFGLAWAGQSKIIFSSKSGRNLNIFVMNADGSGKRQLTVNAGDNYHPTLSADGQYIFYSSNRAGGFNIWRMNADDGSGQKQITDGGGDFYPDCSPDNKWVIYEHQSNGLPTLWKVPIEGGNPVRLTSEYASVPVVSPDGKLIACRYFIQPNKKGIAILPAEEGRAIKLLPIPIIDFQTVHWMDKQRALSYIDVNGGNYNIWSQPIDGGPAARVTNFNTDQLFSYDWSPDGKQLACQRGVILSDIVEISNFR